MDYEKAYKAVLKTATQWIKDGCTDKEKICLECVFPELRESEDERIRRELIEYLRGDLDDITTDDTDRWISWLEKQKEQKPISQEDFDTAKHEALWEEQKPAEWKDYKDKVNIPYCSSEPAWSEEDEKMLTGIIERGSVQVPPYTTALREEQIEWLMNRLKSLRPSWKPSEEHLSALLAVFNDPNNIGSQTCQLALSDLYEQLKKL